MVAKMVTQQVATEIIRVRFSATICILIYKIIQLLKFVIKNTWNQSLKKDDMDQKTGLTRQILGFIPPQDFSEFPLD